MRILVYILEVLVLGFMITAFVFISKQEHIDEVKVEQQADSTSAVKLDRLDNLLEGDTAQIDTTVTADSLNAR